MTEVGYWPLLEGTKIPRMIKVNGYYRGHRKKPPYGYVACHYRRAPTRRKSNAKN